MTVQSSSAMRRIAIVRESLSKVAKILSNNSVLVSQVGVSAYVEYDKKTMIPTRVNLPMLPDDASDELIDAVQGFLDGEIAKVLYAHHKSSLRSSLEKIDGIYKPIESIFCERKMLKAFPGSRANLNNMYQQFVDKFIEPKLKEGVKAGLGEKELFQILAIPALRAWGNQEFFVNYMSDKWPLIENVKRELEPITSKIGSITESEDVYKIARSIQNHVYGEPEKGDGHNPYSDDKDDSKSKSKQTPPKSSPPSAAENDEKAGGASDQDEDGDADESKPGGDSSEDKPDGDADESKPGGDSSENNEPSAPSAGEPQSSGDSDGDSDDSDSASVEGGGGNEGGGKEDNYDAEQIATKQPSKDDTVQQKDSSSSNVVQNFDWDLVQDINQEFGAFVTDLCSQSNVSEPYTVFTKEWDLITEAKVPKSFETEWLSDMENTISAMIGPVAKQLERAFKAQNKSLWQQGQTSGRMSSSNLYRLTAGDDKIFKKKIVHKTRDIAVSLVIDCSGSMSGKKIFTAMCAAWVVCEVLQRLGVDSEVIGFTTGVSDQKSKSGLTVNSLYRELDSFRRKNIYFTREQPIFMPVFKSFKERFGLEQKQRLASFPRVRGSMQSNIDGESIIEAHDRLVKFTSSKKDVGRMMIVFSDGMPSGCADDRALTSHTIKAIKDIEKSGTNIVGVGIMSDAVSRFYRKNLQLNNIDHLPTTVLNQLRDALLAS